MFEDFDKAKLSKEERGRMGVSYLISVGIFVGILAALAAAIATARVVVKRKQRDMDVSFAELPKIAKPKPKPKLVQPGARKAAVRQALKAPTAIPDETPAEAEGELAEAGNLGPVEGFTDGEAGGGGGGRSEQETETVAKPRFVEGCRDPQLPEETLQGTAATIEIEVRMLIDERGRVTTATMLRSHPLVPDELILRCARAQVFAPAHLPDGTAVPYPYHRRFTFRPQGV